MSVNVHDALELHRGRTTDQLGRVVARRPKTTADVAVVRFYRKHLGKPKRKQSLAERAAGLPSPFAVETFLDEISAMTLKPKLDRRLREICRVRMAELRGQVHFRR